jgi:hypothetical protein
MPFEFRFDDLFGADKHHAQAVLACSLDCALYFRLGGAVGTHRVERDHARHSVVRLAGFFNVENFASLIVTALGAGAMGHFLLVTVGAFRK